MILINAILSNDFISWLGSEGFIYWFSMINSLVFIIAIFYFIYVISSFVKRRLHTYIDKCSNKECQKVFRKSKIYKKQYCRKCKKLGFKDEENEDMDEW